MHNAILAALFYQLVKLDRIIRLSCLFPITNGDCYPLIYKHLDGIREELDKAAKQKVA